MKETAKGKKPISAEQIARMATRGEDISDFFTDSRMMRSLQALSRDRMRRRPRQASAK